MTHPLHLKALGLAKEFKRVEADLIGVIQKIDLYKIFRQLGFASLFEYVCTGLQLSESVSYALISVSRKSVEVPELKLAIEQGVLTVSQAKRVTSVLTKENAPELIEKAKTMTQKELEKEVARINPQPLVKERTRYLTEDRLELKVSLKEKSMKKLKRIQDLECQRTRSTCNLEQTLEAMIDFYLERKDPVIRSERILQRPSLRKVSEIDKKVNLAINVRTPLSSEVKHKINQRDKGVCTFQDTNGKRCTHTRWIEIHHQIPVSEGGCNNLENLTTLCHSHHKIKHLY